MVFSIRLENTESMDIDRELFKPVFNPFLMTAATLVTFHKFGKTPF